MNKIDCPYCAKGHWTWDAFWKCCCNGAARAIRKAVRSALNTGSDV